MMARALYPLSAVVGQQAMKTALLLNAVDSSLGGVLIRGHKGTAKSTAVRALAALLPAIDVVPGCPYHCHPDEPSALHDDCRRRWSAGEPLPRGSIPTPLVQLPLNATEDRLVGALHVEHALRTGERRFEPGLLAAAHRGILYIDEVNLLDDHLVDLLLDTAASGESLVEREGISLAHPARFLLVGTMNPEEGELRPQFLDRFGLCVTVQGLAELSGREAVARRRLAYEHDPAAFAAEWAAAEAELSRRVVQGRAGKDKVVLPADLVRLAAQLALAAKAHGHRADIAMLKTARALAALGGRGEATRADLHQAAGYVLPHRLGDDPLATPESSSGRLEELLADVLAERDDEHAPLEDDELLAEAMQVPGGAAAGSILLCPSEKKTP